MTDLVHFEYPPPKSWEQFEELCADLFEAMWSDPSLVRHGRAGQAQNGVDILGARGAIYPVGIQCKKKSQWPEKKLKMSEVNEEVKKADNFKPELKEFYILTTAALDATLQGEVLKLNIERVRQNKFQVVVLFWPEIIRRVALFEHVGRKHFSVGSNKSQFSPLLATWYTRDGHVELSGTKWNLSVGEVGEDFYEWPTGHVIVRQRETDELIESIKEKEELLKSEEVRYAVINLRKKLRKMKEIERCIQDTIRMVFTTERLRFYLCDLNDNDNESDAPEILKYIIESELPILKGISGLSKIRLYPPTPELLEGPFSSSSVAGCDIPTYMPPDEFEKIFTRENEFSKRYGGNEMIKVVSELPDSVRRIYVIPAIIRRINRIIKEDRKTIDEMDISGYLDIFQWKYEY